MSLPKEAIDEFKAIYKKKFGKDLGDADAYDQANRLFNMMKAIYKPLPKTKVLVFTEGTILMPSAGKNVSREERVQQVKNEEASVHDFKNYVPVENAVQTLNTWVKNGCEIYYLTSRRTVGEIADIQNVLLNNGFPSGTLLFRKDGEEYKDVAEKLMPDVLIEDDCESIGGEVEMTYPNMKPELKAKIKHFAVKEFGGIDFLSDSLPL